MTASADRRVLITGLGTVNACGQAVAPFWENVSVGIRGLRRVSRFDAAGFPVQVAGEVPDFDAARLVPRRFIVRTDRFTHFVLAATSEALGDATLVLDNEDRTRVGVWFGNSTGGWDLCERGFVEYYGPGADSVNPWQATGWFLAAPQGFTTIRYGIKGTSKSFSGDRASGAAAFYYGTRTVQWDGNDVVVTGGCEAPVSPLSLACFHSSGDLSESANPASAYRPFSHDADGLVVGEGGTALILEEAEHARRRGARGYLEVLGGAHGTTADGEPAGYARVLRRALSAAGCVPADIDLVLAEGCADKAGDRFELTALAAVFAGRPDPVLVAAPKCLYGHLYGAAFGTDVVCAAMSVQHCIAPPTPGFGGGDLPRELEIVISPRPARIDRVLVCSHSRYGSCIAVVVGRPRADERRDDGWTYR
jgi:3-oxoacyl-[acyl-carrier-protein] synthase II